MIRFRTDGQIDTNFSTDGIATLGTGQRSAGGRAAGLAVDPDGDILVGSAGHGDGPFLIGRLTPAGVPDATWSGDGVQETAFDGGAQAAGLALAPAGGTVLAGSVRSGLTASDLAVARYTSSGALDPAFSEDGRVTTDLGDTGQAGTGFGTFDLRTTSDSIFVSTIVGGEEGVVKYDRNGALDQSYGRGGYVRATRQGLSPVGPDGTAVVLTLGSLFEPDTVARHLPNGSPDLGFGNAGIQTLDAPASITRVAVAPGGKILLFGTSNLNQRVSTIVIRLLANGQPDPGFSTDGVAEVGAFAEYVRAQPSTTEGCPLSSAIDQLGRTVLVGDQGAYGSKDSRVCRLREDGAPDISFGDDIEGSTGVVVHVRDTGLLDPDFGSAGRRFVDGSAGLTGLAIDPDRGIIAAGGTGSAVILARVQAASMSPPDTDVPQTTIDSGPTLDGRAATFAFSAADAGSTFECALDGEAFAACVSPFRTSALAPGDHTFAMRATDPTGRTDPSPASVTFAIADAPASEPAPRPAGGSPTASPPGAVLPVAPAPKPPVAQTPSGEPTPASPKAPARSGRAACRRARVKLGAAKRRLRRARGDGRPKVRRAEVALRAARRKAAKACG